MSAQPYTNVASPTCFVYAQSRLAPFRREPCSLLFPFRPTGPHRRCWSPCLNVRVSAALDGYCVAQRRYLAPIVTDVPLLDACRTKDNPESKTDPPQSYFRSPAHYHEGFRTLNLMRSSRPH